MPVKRLLAVLIIGLLWNCHPIGAQQLEAIVEQAMSNERSGDEVGDDGLVETPICIDQLWRVRLNHSTTMGQAELQCGVIGRANYLHDQRYEFTGNESTFGVESQLAGVLTEDLCDVDVRLIGELYLNQPWDRNQLADYPERESFQHNFEVDTLEISQLAIEVQRDDWTLEMGKFVTPFGRFHLPLYTNARSDVAVHPHRGNFVSRNGNPVAIRAGCLAICRRDDQRQRWPRYE